MGDFENLKRVIFIENLGHNVNFSERPCSCLGQDFATFLKILAT